jgi:hypothetical protein
MCKGKGILYHEPVDSLFDRLYLTLELPRLIRSYTGSDDRARDSACTSESCLGLDEDVLHVLQGTRQRNAPVNAVKVCVPSPRRVAEGGGEFPVALCQPSK